VIGTGERDTGRLVAWTTGRGPELVERARSESVPVVSVQHSDDHIVLGSEGWRIISEQTRPSGARPPAAVIAHTNHYWTYRTALGRTAGTATAADVELGPA
jgi:hypothetical protein